MMHIIVRTSNIPSDIHISVNMDTVFGREVATLKDNNLCISVKMQICENSLEYRSALIGNDAAKIMMFFTEHGIPFEVMNVI